ncbi:MAG TPA: N-glycosylase/DNA lyase [Spirochaetota bacterium]|nr:N-glycosylase/DNA lyase [Spirochaetota bacterium]HOM37575.1 N-glycosylase/DNA lyase [Spirochaetota bacterium]HPQ49454.1 N-glycosylase/DNA lyase [Spirochaetota bacterium]
MIDNIIKTYYEIKDLIKERIAQINNIFFDDSSLLYELFFCILTPQSKARNAGKIVDLLKDKISIINDFDKLSNELRFVRFKNHKAAYIQYAYKKFKPYGNISLKEIIEEYKDDIIKLRDIIVKEVKGIGYKEASHFLRNIGLGKNIAILDRHILDIMLKLKIIDKIPNLSRKEYLRLELLLKDFSLSINIPLDELDFLFWYIKTKDIYK